MGDIEKRLPDDEFHDQSSGIVKKRDFLDTNFGESIACESCCARFGALYCYLAFCGLPRDWLYHWTSCLSDTILTAFTAQVEEIAGRLNVDQIDRLHPAGFLNR